MNGTMALPTADEAFGLAPKSPGLIPAKRDKLTGGTSVTPTSVRIPEGSLLPDDPKIVETLKAAAAKHKINPALLFAMAHQESRYNPDAVGPETNWGKASGMFQFLSSTAKNKGIDPFNYEQAADGAAQDLADQILKKGVDWAVAHHHAGPDPKLHGRKTAAYTQEVLAKAAAIAKELGIEFQTPEGVAVDFRDTPKKLPSAAEAFGLGKTAPDAKRSSAIEVKPVPGKEESFLDTFHKRLAVDMVESGIPIPTIAASVQGIKRSVARGWEGIQDALNRDTVEVERTDGELRRMYDQQAANLFGNEAAAEARKAGRQTSLLDNFEDFAARNRTVKVSAKTVEQEEQEWTKRLQENPQDAYLLPKRLDHLRQAPDDSKFAPANSFKGAMQRIVAGHKSPVDLLLQDSLPANAITYLLNLPEAERQKFDQARNVTKALEIENSPDATAEQRQWAGERLGEWEAKTNPSIKRAWNQLYDAAKQNPGQIGLAFSEALFADPYMVAAPAGIGIKPIRAAQKALAGTTANTIAGRTAKIADAIIDGSLTAGTLNVTSGAMQNLATTGTVNQDEVKLNAAMGILFGGALAPIFMKGAKAKSRLHDTERLRAEGLLDETLADAAKADVELETQIDSIYDRTTNEPGFGTGDKQTPLQKQIAETFGIRNKEEAKAWIAQRRKEVKETFKNESDYADYLEYVAQEKLDRVATLAAEVEAKAAREAAAAEASATRAANYREQWQSDFDKAIEARNAAEETQADLAWQKQEEATAIADKLNAEELMDALYTQDHPTIKRTENSIKRRDAVLKTPKWQRGSADPETLARLGIVGAGTAAGVAIFPEDEKLKGGLLGGLAGLLAPAGGSVLSRMKQAGAISSEGQLIGLLSKGYKLADKLETAEIKARDTAWLEQARAGDPKGFEYLYKAYVPATTRFIKKFTANREARLGMDAEDIVQDAFLDLTERIRREPDFKIDNFPALLNTAAENRAKMALRGSDTDKRAVNMDTVSDTGTGAKNPYEGNENATFSLIEQDAGRRYEVEDAADTPESAAIRDQTATIISQALEDLPKQTQEVFNLVELQHYTLDEAAEVLGISKSGAWHQLKRATNRVNENIAKDRLKYGEPVRGPKNQRGSADPESLKKTALVTAAATAGGTAGYFLYDGDPWKTAVAGGFGAVGGALLAAGGGSALSKALRGIDYRMKEFGPTLYGMAKRHGFQELKGIREYNNATADFITMFNNLSKEVKPAMIRALSTRNKVVIDKMLEQFGGKPFVEAFDKVRTKLDEVEDLLVSYGLIKKSERDYFPFRVKDLDGLKKELGKEAASEIDSALKKANDKMLEKAGRDLNEIERGIVINKILEPYLGKPTAGHMPGFAKARTIQEIPEALQKYYHDPVETLNSYGVQSIKYIERAKFFGKHLAKKKEGNQEFVDISKSIGELVDDLKKKGELTDQQAFELANLLQDRFNGGEKGTHPMLGGMKNLVNASLLGHVASAAVQLGDVAMQGMLHGPRASVKALRRQLMRDKIRKLDDFGLNEHVAHEFLSDGWTRKVSDWSFKWGGFRAIDATGKNFGINAAIERMMRDARTPEGQLKLSDKYQRFFPEEYPKALAALRKGEVNEAVELLAFTDLTKTQPLTQWELPQFYQKFPNGRVLYHLQTFSIRVMNLVYEDAIKGIMSGNVKQAAKGTKALLAIGAVLGVQGAATDQLKNFMSGKPIELGFEQIPVNALEALGLSLYDYNRIADKGPLQGFVEGKLPPMIRMSNDLLNEPERSTRYIPVVGRVGYDFFKEPRDGWGSSLNEYRQLEAHRKARRKQQGYKMEITVAPKDGESRRSDRSRRTERKRRD